MVVYSKVAHDRTGRKAQAWTQAISPTTVRWEENLAQDGGHLYLEGDNLSVLKLLLPQLQGKVQVVYADPPYNTGKNFVYADNSCSKN